MIISGLTAIHQFCSIGNHAFVTGGSLVRKDVPPYVKAAREPLSYVGINSVGLRRRGYESDKIREIQNIYRLLYQKNYNIHPNNYTEGRKKFTSGCSHFSHLTAAWRNVELYD